MFAHIRAGRAGHARRSAPAATTWLAWLLPVFAWAPLTYPGYFQFLNGYSPIFNLDDLARGGAPWAWAPSIGQPYDLLRGEGRLPYALAALPRALGWDNAVAVRLVFAFAILAGALGVYGWARRRLGDWPALLAGSVYAFWPLALATVYVRGAFAEAVLIGLLPFVWWASDAVLASERDRAAASALALALAAAFWTQAGLALWQAASILIFLLISRRGRRLLPLAGWLAGVAAGLLGLVPVAVAHGLTGGPSYVDFAGQFLNPAQLLQPGLAFASSPQGATPVTLGLIACGLAVIGVLLYRQGMVEAGNVRTSDAGDGEEIAPTAPERGQVWASWRVDRFVWFACACVLAPAALSLGLAAPFWRLPLVAGSLTYPWQLLLLAGPWLAWLAGLGGLALARLLPVPAGLQEPTDARSPDSVRQFSAGAVTSVSLFAPLIVLALLAIYGDLNPSTTPAPVPDRPVAVFGDNQIALVSAVISDTLATSDHASVRVQWQALRSLSQDYTVFFHAEGPDGTVYGQQDIMPRAGKAPTSGWQPGAVISDTYTLSSKPGVPPGIPYHYVLGLYQWQTGERLRAGMETQVVLDDR